MSEAAVEHINVADILGAKDAMEQVEKVEAALSADAEVSALVKAAQTVEDVYEIVKKFAKATLEQTKVLFQKTVDYFKETKAVLADEVLDHVSGGWSLSQWWSEHKAKIIAGALVVACVVTGVVVGACTAGLGGAIAGGVIGFYAGLGAGAIGSSVTNAIEGGKK